MKLADFEAYMDEVILERGKDYFEQGHIEKIKEINKGHFIVEVIGSDHYTVKIHMNDAEQIVETYCDCPYDWGEFCKHQAAAFYALRSEKNAGAKIETKNHTIKKADLKTILINLQKDDLIKIILNLSKEYKEIEKKLLFQHAPAKDEISSSKKLIREFINQYKRRGFIEWNDVFDALQGAHMTLDKAQEKVQTGDIESGVSLCLVVLPIVVDMLQYCDDSSGYAGDVIEESLEIIHQSASIGADKLSDPQKEKLFTLLLKEALHKRY